MPRIGRTPSFAHSSSSLVRFFPLLLNSVLTIIRPEDGVHHYDEYGLANIADEPEEIRKIHGEMIAFVMEWLKDRKTN